VGVDYGGHYDRSSSANEASIVAMQPQWDAATPRISFHARQGSTGRIISKSEGTNNWRRCTFDDVAFGPIVGRCFGAGIK
jgi:hypothetical protein